VSVEKSIFGIQTGILGVWVHYEAKLSNEFALRSEVGLDYGFTKNSNENKFALIPNVRLEPRWYYNLEKRNNKGKNIKKNSANFLALNFNYNPNWFVISNIDNAKVIPTLIILPKWGIKRTYGKHFTFETGLGLGPIIYLEKFDGEKSDVGVDLHLRLGYTF
jgi:hypothetical protein